MDRGGRNCSPAARGWRGKINVAAGRGPWTCSTAAKSVPRCFSRSSFQLRRERERETCPLPVSKVCGPSVLPRCVRHVFRLCLIRHLHSMRNSPRCLFSPTLMKLENSVKICDRTIAVNYSRKRFFLIWSMIFLLWQTIIALISLRIIAQEILKTFTLVNRYFLPRRNHDWETSFFPLFKRNYRFARWKFSFMQNARQIVVK